MGAHSTRRNGRAFAIAGRGALTASAAIALVGGGAGIAFAGDAPDHSSDKDSHESWGHDDHGDRHGDDHGDDRGHDRGHDKGDHKGHGHDSCDDMTWDSSKESNGLLGGLDLLGGHDEQKKDDCDGHDKKGDQSSDVEQKGSDLGQSPIQAPGTGSTGADASQ